MALPDPEQERQLARQARMVAFVIAGAMLLWMGAQYVGGKGGVEGRYALLFDFAALAAVFWALVVTYQIWRKRQG